MPDQSDVEAALATSASGILYPDGTAAASKAGVVCRVFRGLPAGPALSTELAADAVNVSITPVEGSYRNTTRFLQSTSDVALRPTLQASVSGDTVSLAGRADAGQLAGVAVDDRTYVYRTGAGDTPAVVAAVLAASVRVDRPAVLSGASVSFPGMSRLVARTVADTPDTLELRRQTQEFRMTVWAPSADLRDTVSGILDVAFAATPFLDVSGAPCRLLSSGSATSDDSQPAGLYRRDLILTVEYPTTATLQTPAMLFGTATDNGRANLA